MRSRLTTSVVAATFAALSACSDSTGAPQPVVTAEVVPASDHQSGLVGTPLPIPLQVRVLTDGEVTPGAAVSWSPSAGSLTIHSGLTNALGIASASWTLGGATGEYAVYASLEGAVGSPVQFTATALGYVQASIVAVTNHQVGVVGDQLPMHLHLKAFVDGQPAAGIEVAWTANTGSLTDRTSLTDAGGNATARWWLGPEPGPQVAQAAVARTSGPPLTFSATAMAGPPARIVKLVGDSQTVPANFPEFGALGVLVTDRLGNALDPGMEWSILAGPLAWRPFAGFERGTYTVFVPTGGVGEGAVRATVGGTSLWVDFTLTTSDSVAPLVVLDRDYRFVSRQNGSAPAVDTVSVGGTVTWLQSYEDPDNDYGVKSVGSPGFLGGWFSHDRPSTFRATFNTPGTYQYVDQSDYATGTVVVQ